MLLVHFNLFCQLHRVIDRQLVIRHGTHPIVNFLLHDFTEEIRHSTSGLLLFFFLLSILCLIVNFFAFLSSFFLWLVLIFSYLFFLAFFLSFFLLLHHLIFQILLFSQAHAILILQQLVLI